MHPVLFTLGPLRVPTYGVCMALGFFISMSLAFRLAGRRGLDLDAMSDLFIIIIISSIVGSRGLFVFIHRGFFWRHPWQIPALWKGGLVFFGGLCLALPLCVWYIRRAGLPLAIVADVLAPCVALGHVFGRLGCFSYGCCYGRPTDLPWGVVFSWTDPLHPPVPRHPTQLYEAIAEFCIFLVLRRWSGRPHVRGTIMLHYIWMYSVFRFFNEFLRDDPRGGVVAAGLSIAQCTSILLVLVTAAALLVMKRRGAEET